MTNVFTSPRFSETPSAPGTHALVIGIGDYAHLADGRRPSTYIGDALPGLSQLTSAPISAQTIVDWLLGVGQFCDVKNAGLKNAAAPLATVESIISTPDAPDLSSSASIQSALRAWYNRCDKNEKNVAFLYICGHGFELQDLVLLASDFGEDDADPWRGSISLDSVRLGMRKCIAQNQFMFFDCCRSYPVLCPQVSRETGLRVFSQMSPAKGQRSQVVLYSTLEGHAAYGTVGQPSRFTSALISAFTGLASENLGGRWTVTHGMLIKSMQEVLCFNLNEDTERLQVVASNSYGRGTSALHELTSHPLVKTRVLCEPDVHMAGANFRLQHADTEALYEHAGVTGVFEKDVAPGTWTIGMTHDDSSCSIQDENPIKVPLMPPVFIKSFEVI